MAVLVVQRVDRVVRPVQGVQAGPDGELVDPLVRRDVVAGVLGDVLVLQRAAGPHVEHLQAEDRDPSVRAE